MSPKWTFDPTRLNLSETRKTLAPTRRDCLWWTGAIAASAWVDLPVRAQGLKNLIPEDQKPILKTFPPLPAEQSKPGTGKFVLFTREPVGKEWDFIAGAWECIPSRPGLPVTKRVEFCHSSWNAAPLLDTLVADGSQGNHPRFVRLQVDQGGRGYSVNLYDIDYRTWDVRCIWQGARLSSFGVLGDSIVCHDQKDWFQIDTSSGKINKEVPFVPLEVLGDFWLVKKPGDETGCWSYSREKKEFVARFENIDKPKLGLSRSVLSPDGSVRVWLLTDMPEKWEGGWLDARLIIQRKGVARDLAVTVGFYGHPGSGVPILPWSIQMEFPGMDRFQFVSSYWKEKDDRIWSIELATGKVTATSRPSQFLNPTKKPSAKREIPVPDYLTSAMEKLSHFGRGALAPAFLLHMGILGEAPQYPDCTTGVSPDGRHILFAVKKGVLAGKLFYGDLKTKETAQWDLPKKLTPESLMEFAWVTTP